MYDPNGPPSPIMWTFVQAMINAKPPCNNDFCREADKLQYSSDLSGQDITVIKLQ
jgi:hypothetical protein